MTNEILVLALYRFTRLEDYRDWREPLLEQMRATGVRGTLLLAREGINGTISGPREAVEAIVGRLRADPRLAGLTCRETLHAEHPFRKAKVKLKKEIVTLGVEGLDPERSRGTYLDPERWNDVIRDPETLVIDTRNQYEYEVGTFEGALNPETTSFREFPDYVREQLDPVRHRRVAMFCTGGIRCEKSTALLREQGFEEVYHLEGGILNYLEKMPRARSLWKGECFVFDERVTVNHELAPGSYDQCHACRRPISEEDKRSPEYEPAVSCPRCYPSLTPEKRARLAERRRQIELARKRGERHLAVDPPASATRE